MVAKDPLFFFKIKRSRKQGQARYLSIYLAADISKELWNPVGKQQSTFAFLRTKSTELLEMVCFLE
jgi:hypothetical protein